MTFQYLVSVLNCNDINKLINDENINADAIIINQCDKNNNYEINKKDFTIKVIETTERGLSKSRNMALKYATADICLICDDDEVFLENTKETILNAFVHNPKNDIIRFQIQGINKKYKKYKKNIYKINNLNFGNISSVEIAVKRKNILNNNLYFDENFGAGAKYQSGEENIFIIDCLKKKLNILYVPATIAKLYCGINSTWFKGYNETFFITKGAFFQRISSKFAKILGFLFLIKPHRQNVLNNINFIKAYKSILNGIKLYKEEVNNENS